MTKKLTLALCILATIILTVGCSMFNKDTPQKIGISFGSGHADRWPQEQAFMESRAKELGFAIISKLNTPNSPQSQTQDCLDMIDSGIDALIIMPRNGNDFIDVIRYAHSKNIKVIAYARPIINQSCDLFIGYDTYRIGQTKGMYVSELVQKGNYIVLRGDKNDYNSTLLYKGIMTNITPALTADVSIILDEIVPDWSPDTAKKMVRTALQKNNLKINAIIAPNDKIAEACRAVLTELNIKNEVVITGMDAELSAVQRIVKGEQSLTIYMNLKDVATITINQLNNMLAGKKVLTNSEFLDSANNKTPAYLIGGKSITKDNIDRVLIDSGIFTKEQVYVK